MREIIFRGKERTGILNHAWLVGALDNINEESPKIIIPDRYGNPIFVDVAPETVGQFTGLTDKNGKRIFEGDIVDVEYDIQYFGVATERIGLFVVVFDDGCFMKQKKDGGLFHFIPSDKCKVVGNIHDNPELLED